MHMYTLSKVGGTKSEMSPLQIIMKTLGGIIIIVVVLLVVLLTVVRSSHSITLHATSTQSIVPALRSIMHPCR
jgi:flagellar biosynthesis/type III secretory pathway M-ring protein FliF/YscJ